ncbi:MAG: elongation factor P maturation arginine rhamnosyltransferase EarP [Nitrosomonas sp.]|nr:MAG: elongation factor P maturation arginine rhamnosyltransferase EarP [Nitrosomonas sp.]
MGWDLFCRVIDNYGDIGFCWRLSRQLTTEYGLAVRLWVDDLASLQRICPSVDPHQTFQQRCGVQINHWTDPFPDIIPADVVIEAYGCELPEKYIQAMLPNHSRGRQPVWINLEYLSAESWVEEYHGLCSPHPRLPLTKYFFFPGFTVNTGGLLREKNLLTQRDSVQHNAANWWLQNDLPIPDETEIVISLFCYDTAPISNLLEAWTHSQTPIRCVIPEGQALTLLRNGLNRSALKAGDVIQQDKLTVQIIPFLPQAQYDQLLWLCDCNFVRGEDSFVRAQWAGRPFVWQIYPQADNVHHVKLEAFLNRYLQSLTKESAQAFRAFHHGWNGRERLDWNHFWQHHAIFHQHALTWSSQLAVIPDLTFNLVEFCKRQ